MQFGKKKSRSQGETTHWERVAAALEGVERASRTAKAATDYAAGRQAWIAALLPHFEALGVAVPYFQSLTLLLAGLANSQRGERLELVNRTRRAVAEATEHMQALARSAEAKGANKAKKEPSKRSEYGRLAKAMTTPALMAQIESHKALLKTAEKTPETAGARRELKSELAAFEREATKRGGAPKAPKVSKAPKKEPKTPKAKRTPKEKKLKKPEMAARLLAHHAREKGEKKAKRAAKKGDDSKLYFVTIHEPGSDTRTYPVQGLKAAEGEARGYAHKDTWTSVHPKDPAKEESDPLFIIENGKKKKP